ncbi:hypothetical protein FQN60_013117 [Etheostoma spectabile]|uniref:Angiomotin C-terminal domain-containing protein n=1 Tax=Etheostoma spectabile TaxID=54343 RepID=A0A5J5D4Y0_9PERO|nr:hypothetical protein FQN60_013117 [Etheostoma spectabile]
MRTAEGSSGTVLHRLIQEQLRYGNLTDTRTLLAIQQQALRGGSGGGGTGSPRSSLESLTQEESQFIQMSTRQEPQGQEHQGDCLHSESQVCHLYQLHGEELPTYEEAKAHSQYRISQKEQQGPNMHIIGSHSEGQWDLKREHTRSLSDRLMQLSLERNGPRDTALAMSPSHSYPQLYNNMTNAVAPNRQAAQQHADQRGPPPDYPLFARLPGYMLSHSQDHGQYVSAQSQVAHNSIPAASSDNSAQNNVLMRENERLRKELEVYVEKAARLQKLELEIQRISEAYETLMKGSAKRETLEKTMRNKLEAEIKRMHDFNRDLRDQLDSATKQRAAKEAQCSDQRQHVFVKLLEQKQQREREQLERQIQHLRVSGEECQRRRELLEQALASTQARNRQLEEELQRKRAYVEKSQRQAADPMTSGLSSTLQLQQLREKEERILALEADITKWEQKYLEESTMRQFAMDAAATAATQRDTTIINHSPRHSPNNSFNEDLPLASHRHQEMENRIHALHAQLLEKDAVIKVIQQRSRWEQGRLERQGLRLARSVPSINTVTSNTECKGKSLSDDQTGAAVLQPQPSVGPRAPSRDSSTQSDEVPLEQELPAEPGTLMTSETMSRATTDTSVEPKAPLKTFKSINNSDGEVVEILI